MMVSIRLSEEEKELAESYAKLHSISLDEAFKRALFEQIEDEYDFKAANEAYKEYVDSGCNSMPAEEFWRKMDHYEIWYESSISSNDNELIILALTIGHRREIYDR